MCFFKFVLNYEEQMSNVSKSHTFVDLADKPPKLHFISVPMESASHLQLTHSLWATAWASIPTTELESQISYESRVFGWRAGAI